jgi:uncharacterized metal-binding protein YceD (DUF177 family)
MRKLEFKINEIQKGKSEDRLELNPVDVDIQAPDLRNLVLNVHFDKQEAVLSVGFDVEAEVLLICDRSLDTFWHSIHGSYTVLFKDSASFETEDDHMSVRRLDISGNIINIQPEVRDTIMLAIPLRQIHPRFFNENGELIEFLHIEDVEPSTDPRWDALKVLKDTSNN